MEGVTDAKDNNADDRKCKLIKVKAFHLIFFLIYKRNNIWITFDEIKALTSYVHMYG